MKKLFFIFAAVTEVDVIYIDYGNRERVKSCKLRVLPDHLTLLPAQAICCALAEVGHLGKNQRALDFNWPLDVTASTIYLGQVMQKRVLSHMRTTKVQISLRILAVWSAPLLFAA